MTVEVQARVRGGRWRIVRRSCAELRSADETIINGAMATGKARLLAEFSSMPANAGVWRLELPKACLDEGEIAIGLAEYLAEQCCLDPGREHAVRALEREVSVRSIVLALRERGQSVAGGRAWQAWDRAQLAVAALAAMVMWLATLARSIHEPKLQMTGAEWMLAVHGEWSNRTRHVLGWLKELEQPAPIIVLGRPRMGLEALAARLERELGVSSLQLIRPFSIVSAIVGLPAGIRLVVEGMGRVAGARFKPPFSQQAAMFYRVLSGAASACWWRRGGFQCKVVIYGHTGLGDTTQLELAQQKTGARTVHVVHGVSAGLNFVGLSDHAFWHTGHDAAWHRRLGGYGACHAPPLDPPVCSRGPQGWLMMTNYLHPMNRAYRTFGVRDELRVLEAVAKVADAMLVPREAVVWKPHPVFEGLPGPVRTSVLEVVSHLGFKIWNPTWEYEAVRRFHVVFCTASTVAIDLLKWGILPVLLDMQPLDPKTAIAQLPLRADGWTVIQNMLHEVVDDAEYDWQFDGAWQRIAPARSVDLAFVRQIRSGDS